MPSGRTRREKQQRRQQQHLNQAQNASATFIKDTEVGRVCQHQVWQAFRRWLMKAGLPNAYLNLSDFDATGRGMMATRDIMPGDDLVRIPDRLLITARSLHKHYASALKRCTILPPTHALMAYYLAAERHQGPGQSNIWPYIAVLPQNFDTLPVCYPPCLLALLPKVVQDMANEQKKKIHQQYELLCSGFLKNNPSLIRISRDAFQWGWLNVNTRCVYLDDTAGTTSSGDRIALAPFLDMLNHHPDAEMHAYFDQRTQCYTIRTQNAFRRGRQAFINYGPHDNCFLLELTHLNVLCEPTGTHDTIKDVEAKTAFLRQEGFLGDYALYRDGEIPLRLFRALQIWLLPRFCLSEPTTQRAIEYWRQILYQDIESTASTDLVHWTEPSMVWRAIRQLLQHAIHQAKDRLCQLKQLKYTIQERYQLGWTFTHQLWEETIDILNRCLDTAQQHL